jgi:hypothetical protein
MLSAAPAPGSEQPGPTNDHAHPARPLSPRPLRLPPLAGERLPLRRQDRAGVAIYNPWSVLNYLSLTPRELLPYWIDTSSNDLVRDLLLTGPAGVREELEVLLAGGTIDKRIEENIVLRDVAADPGSVWSFLLFTGYLKSVELRLDAGETPEKALVAALSQIRERDYAAELRERGAAPIHLMAAVFDGKRAYVRVG